MASPQVYVLGLLGLALLGLGELLHIVGLATPDWSTASIFSFGLWSSCISDICAKYVTKPTEVEVCEAFAIIGMLCGGLAGALGLGYFVLLIIRKQRIAPLALGTAAAGSVAAGSILVCIIVWAVAINETGDLGYSFALSITGGILLALGANIVFLASRQSG